VPLGAPIPPEARRKIALPCSVREDAVVAALDAPTIYQVPIAYHEEGLDVQLLRALGLATEPTPISKVGAHRQPRPAARGRGQHRHRRQVCGPVRRLQSLNEALIHGGIANNVRVQPALARCRGVRPAPGVPEELQELNGCWSPAARRARFRGQDRRGHLCANEAPALLRHLFRHADGLHRGCRLVGVNGASSTEFGPCPDPIVGLLTEWDHDGPSSAARKAGTWAERCGLGAYPARLEAGSLVGRIYDSVEISERHRHRYEVNINYRPALERAGLRFSGMSPDGRLPEIIELPEHPWFVGVPVPPGAQIPADGAASAVRGVREGGARAGEARSN